MKTGVQICTFYIKVAWGHDHYPINTTTTPSLSTLCNRKANEMYTQHIVRIVDELLSSLSVGLGLEKQVLKEALGGEELEMLMKINYYPPCPRPDLALGVVPHTDLSALTVLVPNCIPGLQFFKDENWFNVNYIPGALIIHIGDQVQVISMHSSQWLPCCLKKYFR